MNKPNKRGLVTRLYELVDQQARMMFTTGWNAMQNAAHLNAVDKGFWDDQSGCANLSQRNQGEMLMLMVTELAEAMEALRDPGKMDKHVPEMGNLEVELADCVIRIMDFAAAFRLDVAQAVIRKMSANCRRPYKHGKIF
jgi:NTP pyrophosphatase (non-canonical NTP hydrolase)